MAQSRIAELASIIQVSTAAYEDYCTSVGLPMPSFAADGPLFVALPPEISSHRTAILEATDELNALMKGPVETIFDVARNGSASLHAVSRFNIASSFCVGESATFDQIAANCGLGVVETRRLLRHAMTMWIFKEEKPGVVAHTAASRALLDIPLLADWVALLLNDMWPSQTRIVDAMLRWPGSQEPNHTGFNLAHSEEESVFKVLGKDSSRLDRFKRGMMFLHNSPGFETRHVYDLFDWGAYEQASLVDVGGSHGLVCVELARKLPKFNFIVQDLPEVIAEGASIIPEDLSKRIVLVAHDFFKAQPARNMDFYFLRWIFHDWPDQYCLKILRNLIPALKAGSRILINEICIPDRDTIPFYQERSLRRIDMDMMGMQNSMERDAMEWSELLHKADSRFKLVAVRTAPASVLALIEVLWEG